MLGFWLGGCCMTGSISWDRARDVEAFAGLSLQCSQTSQQLFCTWMWKFRGNLLYICNVATILLGGKGFTIKLFSSVLASNVHVAAVSGHVEVTESYGRVSLVTTCQSAL
jgi:hypothetical protein